LLQATSFHNKYHTFILSITFSHPSIILQNSFSVGNRFLLIISLIWLLGGDVASISAQSWNWGRMAAGNGEGCTVTTHGANNVYYTGYYDSTIVFGTDTLKTMTFGPAWEAFLVKYDRAGNVIWARQSGSVNLAGSGYGLGVTTDPLGNIFMSGEFQASIRFGNDTLNEFDPNYPQAFLAKYDPGGTPVWAIQSFAGSIRGTAAATGVACDPTGNTLITGVFNDTVYFGSQQLVGQGIQNVFFAEYDILGHCLWAKAFHKIKQWASIYSADVASDARGNWYAIGNFADTVEIDSSVLVGGPIAENAFLLKLDASGNVIWVRQSFTSSISTGVQGSGIAVDQSGNCCITGGFIDSTYFGHFLLTSTMNNHELFLVKYDSFGNVLWAKQSNSLPYCSFSGNSIDIDLNRRIYVSGANSGYYNGNSATRFGMDTLWAYPDIPSASNDPAFVAMFDSLGNYLCGSGIATGGDDINGIAVDPQSGEVFFSGDVAYPTRIGPDSLSNGGHTESPFIASWEHCSLMAHPSLPDFPSTECPQIYIPNTFSPNDDGHNEMECVYGGCIRTLDFMIYDRWGEKVFESLDLKKCWDGTYQGQLMNPAVFAYYLTAVLDNGQVVTQKGMINLIK